MSENISESLNLPKVGGTLITYVVPYEWKAITDFQDIYPQHKGKLTFWITELKEFKEYCNNNIKKYFSVDWKLQFIFHGPNARYNSGIAEISSKNFNEFINDLEDGLKKMEILLKTQISGTYNKKIGSHNNPSLDISAENNKVFLQFWVHSGTYKFSRQLDKLDTENLINQLKLLPEKAQKLMQSLEELSL